MTLGTTRIASRTRGPLALSGGLVVATVVLTAVALERPAPDLGAPIPSLRATSGVETVKSAPAPLPSGRVRVAGPASSSSDEAFRADAPPARPQAPESTADWAAHYRGASLAELESILPDLFGDGGGPNQRVGFLEALAEHGGAASRPGFLAAAAYPGDPDTKGSISLASYAVGQLQQRAQDPAFRATLSDLAWDPSLGLAPRLRGRAVSALVRTAPADEAPALRAHLWREQAPGVHASALGALRLAAPELRLALADLYPGEDLATWTPSSELLRER